MMHPSGPADYMVYPGIVVMFATTVHLSYIKVHISGSGAGEVHFFRV